MQYDFRPGHGFAEFGQFFGGWHLGQAYSSFGKVDGGQTDYQRNGRNHFKINQRFDAHSAHGFDIRVASNTDQQCSKEQRRNNGFDQLDENLTQHAVPFGSSREGMSYLCSKYQRE